MITPEHSGALSVSIADAAKFTSFSQAMIRDAINRGQLPAMKNGRRLAIRVSDLTAWLDALPRVADAS